MEEKLLVRNLKDPETRERAFAEAVQLYQQPLYWHIRKMVHVHDDADDLLQATFIKAWRNISGFREEAKLKTWLFRIATNETLTFLNRQKKRQHTELSNIEDHVSHSTSSGGYMEGDEIQARLLQAVEQLPEKQRLVFNMKYFEELKYEEMAEILGGSVGSLKASYHHAVKKIEKYITSH